jgi:hypothetical protein
MAPPVCASGLTCIRTLFIPDLPGRCVPIVGEGEVCGSKSTVMGICDDGLECVYINKDGGERGESTDRVTQGVCRKVGNGDGSA